MPRSCQRHVHDRNATTNAVCSTVCILLCTWYLDDCVHCLSWKVKHYDHDNNAATIVVYRPAFILLYNYIIAYTAFQLSQCCHCHDPDWNATIMIRRKNGLRPPLPSDILHMYNHIIVYAAVGIDAGLMVVERSLCFVRKNRISSKWRCRHKADCHTAHCTNTIINYISK